MSDIVEYLEAMRLVERLTAERDEARAAVETLKGTLDVERITADTALRERDEAREEAIVARKVAFDRGRERDEARTVARDLFVEYWPAQHAMWVTDHPWLVEEK